MSSNFLTVFRIYFYIFLLLMSVGNGHANGNGWHAPKEWTDSNVYDSLRCGLFLKVETDEKQLQSAKRFFPTGGEEFSFRIMGGENVEEGISPWTAAIFRQKKDKATYICSGTLISKRHVVTAAHCMFGGSVNKICFSEEFKSADEAKTEEMCRQPKGFLSVQKIREQISVYIGSICLSEQKETPCESPKTQRKFRVKNAMDSAFCKKKCASDDLIVLELDLDGELGGAVPAQLANHICLPFMHGFQDDFYWRQSMGANRTKALRVTGWGSAPDKQKPSQYGKAYPKLQMLEVPNIWRHEKCARKRAKLSEEDGLGLSEDKLCTVEEKSRDTCLGDSGGGLVGNFEDGKGRRRWFILGVLSSGGDCLKLQQGLEKPLIQEFTNVTFHKNAIENFVNGNLNKENPTTEETKEEKVKEDEEDEAEEMWGDCQ